MAERDRAEPLPIRIVRALVEATAFAGLIWWGWTLGKSVPTRAALAIIVLTIPGLLWVYAGTPGDPARRMPPRLALAGPGRLLLEVTILGIAAFAVWTTVSRAASETFLTVAVVLYVVTWDRLLWLLRH